MVIVNNRQYKEESQLLAAAKNWLEPREREGIKVMRICDRYTKGYSDLFICVHGRLVVAELKDDTGVPSVQQLEFIDEIIRAGGTGGVCRSLKDIENLINSARYCTHQDPHTYDGKYCNICGKEVKRP